VVNSGALADDRQHAQEFGTAVHDDKSQSEGHTADTVWCDGACFFARYLIGTLACRRADVGVVDISPMFVRAMRIAVQSCGIRVHPPLLNGVTIIRYLCWPPLRYRSSRLSLFFHFADCTVGSVLMRRRCIHCSGSGAYSFFPAAVGGSAAPPPDATATTLRAGRGFLLRCIAWATTLSLRHRNQHCRITTCPHTGCHVSTIYFSHPPIAPLNLIPQKPQRISPLIARR
jgi:hypothetical protein